VIKLYNEKLYNLCCSPDSISVIKLRRMRWVGHINTRGRHEMNTKLS
jgi:hypothetical protein